ncbi:type II toxin-antitoxin system HipA family toxin [Vibrio superstes]|uniref:HipA family protein n=1 Tax=Vibrio superstes NBRC 103154 TaxID=1219062 RepID=A0A511QU12_9VIBR|nr:type II toxin-antitoxin system HipA family toxin [Vibrio superstes]GEM80844.1 hipA family protein [Vibrio superstes NBRC 103154]
MSISLPQKVTKLSVLAQGDELGLLTHGSTHIYTPTQEERYVSLTMTKKALDSYSSGSLHPIFAQNLPEGFNRRFIAEKLARYAKVNDMYLLALQGDNGIGMLSYKGDFELPNIESVSLQDILTYSSKEPLFPQLLEKYYLRNSLAGVQPKVSVPVKIDRTIEQKDLIVKSFDREFTLLTVNEYVCMEAARFCGLEPPKTYLSDSLETFVVERFDSDKQGKKLGYEDFTTLLKKPNDPDSKYTSSYETLLKATHLYTNDMAEVERMYRYIVFNCLIGNGDAHLKNFALQYDKKMKNVRVSPPFDITHTLIYDSIDNKMALKMANSKVFPDREHLLKLGESRTFNIRDRKYIIEEMGDLISDFLTQSEEIRILDGMKDSIEKHLSNSLKRRYSTKSYRHDRKLKFE